MRELIKDVVYGAVEMATANRGISRNIGGEDIRFPVRYCRYYPSGYEPELFRFLKRYLKPGDTFFDCGAHFGLFSVVASRIVGQSGLVVSFEPSENIRSVLQRVIEINGLSNVEVRSEALSGKSGFAVFYDTGKEGSNANSLVEQQRHHGSTSVPTISVDEISQSRGFRANCMKIDVEGAEYELLSGARESISQNRPAIFLSVHPFAISDSGSDLASIWKIVTDLEMEVLHRGKKVGKSWFEDQTDLFDVECVPA